MAAAQRKTHHKHSNLVISDVEDGLPSGLTRVGSPHTKLYTWHLDEVAKIVHLKIIIIMITHYYIRKKNKRY